jgi:hypothetical protein
MKDYAIFAKDADKTVQSELEFIGIARQERLNLIKRELRIDCHSDFEKHLKYLLYVSGWIYVPKEEDALTHIDSIDLLHDTEIPGTVYKQLIHTRIPANFLSDVLTAQQQNPKRFEQVFTDLINTDGVVNMKTFVGEQISTILERDVVREVGLFMDAIWITEFKVGGKCIGNGELALTLLTGAVKSTVGDLKLPDGSRDIELKADLGRPGSEHFAENGLGRRLADIINVPHKQFTRYTLYDVQRKRTLISYEQLSAEELIYRNNIRLKLKQAELTLRAEVLRRRQADKQILKSTERSLENLIQVKRFVWNVGKKLVPTNCIGTGVSKNECRRLKNIYNKKKELLKLNIDNYKIRDEMTFFRAVEGFFLNSRFNPSVLELVDGYIAIRNHELTSDHLIVLREGLLELFCNNPVSELTERATLERWIATMHIYCYWYDHQFTDLMIIRNESKNLQMIHCPIDNSYSVASIFELIYNQLSNIEIACHLGGQGGTGVQMTLGV